MKVSDIFKVKTGKRIIEEDIYNHKGKFPCITAQTQNNGITWYGDEEWLQANYKESIIYDECITWSKDGAKAGTLFYRNYPFYPNDHCGVLIPKKEYKDKINLKWFVYTQQEYIKGCVTQQNSQGMLYNGEMSELEIQIPLTDKGEIDIDYQNRIVEQYEKLQDIKKDLNEKLEAINNIGEYSIMHENTIEKFVSEIFSIYSEDHKFTEEYVYKNQGIYPIYSATLNRAYGYVSSFSYSEPIILVVNYGDAGKTRCIEGKYNIGRNVCGLKVKDEYKNLINIKYMQYALEKIFLQEMNKGNMGAMSQDTIKNILIKLPANEKGEIDIEFQNKVAKQYEILEELKSNINKILKKI